MAAVQMDDYLKNGNIRNSVNFPDVTLERAGSARICLIHRNIPGMLTNIMPVFSRDGINIENMTQTSHPASLPIPSLMSTAMLMKRQLRI